MEGDKVKIRVNGYDDSEEARLNEAWVAPDQGRDSEPVQIEIELEVSGEGPDKVIRYKPLRGALAFKDLGTAELSEGYEITDFDRDSDGYLCFDNSRWVELRNPRKDRVYIEFAEDRTFEGTEGRAHGSSEDIAYALKNICIVEWEPYDV